MIIGDRSGNAGNDPSQLTPLSVAAAAPMIGLDPVQLEFHYLALCSMYTAHMGQGKGAAQIATKHAISDL